jgi:dienelactone hydrolase
MIVNTEYADISLLGSPMRTFVAAPKAEGQYPGIWCYSDIFQLTPPLVRFCVRLAGRVWICSRCPGNLSPHRTAGNGDLIR